MENKKENNNKDLIIIEDINKKISLKKRKAKDSDLFPIGVRHQKELKVLFRKKYHSIQFKLDSLKKNAKCKFLEFYEEDIKISELIVLDLNDRIEKLISSEKDIIKKPLGEFLILLKEFKEKYKGNLDFITDSDRYSTPLQTFLCINHNSLDLELQTLSVIYIKQKLNYATIVNAVFEENYLEPYNNLYESLNKIEDKFNEAVVLGDFGDVREIYYYIENVDEFISKLEEPEIIKIDNIFVEEEEKLVCQLKEFTNNKKNQKSNKNKVVDVDVD